MTDLYNNPSGQVHQVVIDHLNEVEDLRRENEALRRDNAALQMELHDQRAENLTLKELHHQQVFRIDWYSRNYANLLTSYRAAAQMMTDGFAQTIKDAHKHALTEEIADAGREVAALADERVRET